MARVSTLVLLTAAVASLSQLAVVSATYNTTILAANKKAFGALPAGSPLPAAFAALKKNAETVAASSSIYSVVNDKFQRPKNVDMNDFVGFSRYYSPNCTGVKDVTNPDIQCPWYPEDGKPGPNLGASKHVSYLNRLTDDMESLAIGYYFFGEEKWAARANQLLDAWFVAPATKMNPHADFASTIRGPVWQGDLSGVLKTRQLARLIDLAGFFGDSTTVSQKTRDGIKSWVSAYVKYMINAPLGKPDYTALNNHGTSFHNMLISFYAYMGHKISGRDAYSHFVEGAFNRQIMKDGSQPRELKRPDSFHYSTFNIGFLIEVAERSGQQLGLNMWNEKNTEGANINDAAEYLAPFALGEKEWPYQNGMQPETLKSLAEHLVKIRAQYGDMSGNRYAKIIAKYGGTADPKDPSSLWLSMP